MKSFAHASRAYRNHLPNVESPRKRIEARAWPRLAALLYPERHAAVRDVRGALASISYAAVSGGRSSNGTDVVENFFHAALAM